MLIKAGGAAGRRGAAHLALIRRSLVPPAAPFTDPRDRPPPGGPPTAPGGRPCRPSGAAGPGDSSPTPGPARARPPARLARAILPRETPLSLGHPPRVTPAPRPPPHLPGRRLRASACAVGLGRVPRYTLLAAC